MEPGIKPGDTIKMVGRELAKHWQGKEAIVEMVEERGGGLTVICESSQLYVFKNEVIKVKDGDSNQTTNTPS